MVGYNTIDDQMRMQRNPNISMLQTLSPLFVHGLNVLKVLYTCSFIFRPMSYYLCGIRSSSSLILLT